MILYAFQLSFFKVSRHDDQTVLSSAKERHFSRLRRRHQALTRTSSGPLTIRDTDDVRLPGPTHVLVSVPFPCKAGCRNRLPYPADQLDGKDNKINEERREKIQVTRLKRKQNVLSDEIN